MAKGYGIDNYQLTISVTETNDGTGDSNVVVRASDNSVVNLSAALILGMLQSENLREAVFVACEGFQRPNIQKLLD